MSCDEANTFIEAVAVGDAVPEPIRLHVAACPRCAARLALAERIEVTLSHRPVPVVSQTFTTSVIKRLRRERWHSEQVVDISFNVAVAIGALLIVSGVAGFAWRSGVMQLGGEMATVLFAATRTVAARVVTDARVIMIGVLLLSTAAGLWWWAEEDASVY